MEALRLPARADPVPYGFGSGLHASLRCSCSQRRSRRARRMLVGPGVLVSRLPVSGMLHPWARAGSLRFPGDPSHAFALFQDPGRAGRTSPMAVLTSPPPVNPNRRPQRVHYLGADAGLQHPLSTLHERRRRRPCKTRFRLAGCASTGRGSNPLDRDERFKVTLPSSSPELALTQGSSTTSGSSVSGVRRG